MISSLVRPDNGFYRNVSEVVKDHQFFAKGSKVKVVASGVLPKRICLQQLCGVAKISYKGIFHDQQVIFCDEYSLNDSRK